MGGKSSQTNALSSHIDASNLWTFFQAKTIRANDHAHGGRGGRGDLQGQLAGHAGDMAAQTERWRQRRSVTNRSRRPARAARS